MVIGTNKAINQRIAAFRKMAGISQKEMAGHLGMKPSTYSRLESRGNFKPETIIQISRILRISVSRLIGDEDTAQSRIEPLPTDAKTNSPAFDQSHYILVNPIERTRFNAAKAMSHKNQAFLIEVLGKLQGIKYISGDKAERILKILDE